MTRLDSHGALRFGAPILAILLLVPLVTGANLTIAPSQTDVVSCPTELTMRPTAANDVTLECAATATARATPTASPTPPPAPTAAPTATRAPTAAPTAAPRTAPTAAPAPSDTPPTSLAFPIRAAFYYPWFPEGWNQQGLNPFTRYTPSLGFYDSSSVPVIKSHVASMESADIQAGIASYWGIGTPTAGRVPGLLANAGLTFRWALYYEPEGSGNQPIAALDAELDYIAANFASHPAFLRVAGKPVLFVWGGAETCELTTRWAAANADRFHLVVKVFAGYRTCATQPNGWHQYGPASPTDHQVDYSYTISPGFWRPDEPAPRLARDPDRWAANIASMVASREPWQLITSFSEWGEGTTIEPANEYGTTYLDILGGAAPPAPTPTPPTPAPTPVATAPQPPTGSVTLIGAGDIASSLNDFDTRTGDLIRANPDATVFTLGDNCYESASLACMNSLYAESWGSFQARTMPVIGNHEGESAGSGVGYCTYFGAPAHCNALGNQDGAAYYSYDVGAWHVVVLNSNCGRAPCEIGSAQYNWLAADLTAHPNTCVMAMWHHPRFSSGEHSNDPRTAALVELLYDLNADVILSGHDHNYERFGLLNAAGALDESRGIRHFIVGTGGKDARTMGTLKPGSVVRSLDMGVLKLTLHAATYDWQFIPAAGFAFTDSGSGTCH